MGGGLHGGVRGDGRPDGPGIGKIVAELKRTGQFDNTLILFLQDNGGCAEPMGRKADEGPPRHRATGSSPTFPAMRPEEFAAAGSVPKQTRDGYPVRDGAEGHARAGRTPTSPTAGAGRTSRTRRSASTSTGSTRAGSARRSSPTGRRDPAEGRAPEAARPPDRHRWPPASTSPARLTRRRTPIRRSKAGACVPAFAGKPLDRDALFWEHEGNRAVRSGDWKLVAKHDKPWELYDLSKDRVESTNLASKMPEKVEQLAAKYASWAKRARVETWPVRPLKANE